MDEFFNPRSVAIIGASSHEDKLGYYPLFNCKEFKGKIYPVTLHSEEILGHKCYKNVLNIPDEIDLAIIILPAESVSRALMECKIKGINNVVIYSSGFAESGNYELHNQILIIGHIFGMKIVGPNTNGVTNFHNGFNVQIQNGKKQTLPKAGGAAFASQSGTFGIWLMEWAAKNNIGMSKYISYGNRCVVDEADIIEYLLNDDDTKIIALYVEGAVDFKRLDKVVNESKKKKPIVVFKGGKRSATSLAIIKHTGNNSGCYDHEYYRFRKLGFMVTDDLTEFYAIIKGLVLLHKINGRGVAMVTNGGGPCIVASDFLNRYGFTGMSLDTQTKIKEASSKLSTVGKYITDLTGTVTPEDYGKVLQILSGDDDIHMIVVGLVLQNTWSEKQLLQFFIYLYLTRCNKPVIVMTYGNDQDFIGALELSDIPVYDSPRTLARVIHSMYMSRDKY